MNFGAVPGAGAHRGRRGGRGRAHRELIAAAFVEAWAHGADAAGAGPRGGRVGLFLVLAVGTSSLLLGKGERFAHGFVAAKSGLFVGINKGHVVTKRELPPRPCERKGKGTKRVHFARNLIREVAEFAPYEKRITELLKVGKDKRALKVAKRKLGTHKRAKKKKRGDVQCPHEDE
ncbi:60S ribosomal protein L36-like [Triticum urartu]|uniref:60S ribosomal protein L36-like n=1 Tax=Triticum urartu TaxID=4572 RepID=UPI0020447808|nr:60S ribosomal protein L36-like [Triticum urartu]